MPRIEIPSGTRFGRLVIVEEAPRRIDKDGSPRRQFACLCDCGNRLVVPLARMRSGHTHSCGCLNRDARSARVSTHGMSSCSEYKIWVCMIQRCHNPKRHEYRSYGGRGIVVCKRWQDSFEAFYADVGPRPSMKHSIDRFPNQNGNYEPGNCRWATRKQQQQNMRSNRLLTYKGETLCVGEWARRVGIGKVTLYNRIKQGWPIEAVLETPPRYGNRVSRGSHGGSYLQADSQATGSAW